MINFHDIPVCQSCSMPPAKTEDFGTNTDGSANSDYCINCFSGGAFRQANMTKDEMVDQVTELLAQTEKAPIEQVRLAVDRRIRNLRRWQ